MDEQLNFDRPVFDWTQCTFQRFVSEPTPPAKNVIFIQHELNQKKMKNLKPPEPIEKLYKLDETRRQVMAVLQEKESIRKNNPQCSWHPEIDKNSEKITQRMDPQVVNRVYSWQNGKEQRLNDMIERQREEERQRLEEETAKYKYVNSNFEVDSKVKNFVDSMDYKKQMKGSRVIYQSHIQEAHNPPLNQSGGFFQPPIQYMSEPAYGTQPPQGLTHSALERKVFGATPQGDQGDSPALKKGNFRKVGGNGPELPNVKQVSRATVRDLVKDI